MRLVGHNDLQGRTAYQPTIVKQGGRYIAYVGHHGGSADNPKPIERAHRPGRAQRHVGRRRHRSEESEIYRPHSRRGRRRRGGRGADDARVRRHAARQGRSQQGLSAARLRPRRSRDLRRDRSGASQGAGAHPRDDRHPQELLGVRRRYRLSRLDAARLAHPHGPGLRPQRSGQSGEDPRLRAGRTAARRDRRGAAGDPRPGLDRAEGQPRLSRLRHQQGRHHPDRRPREAAEGTEGADAGQSAVSAGRPPRHVAARRRRTPPCRSASSRSRNSPRRRKARNATWS